MTLHAESLNRCSNGRLKHASQQAAILYCSNIVEESKTFQWDCAYTLKCMTKQMTRKCAYRHTTNISTRIKLLLHCMLDIYALLSTSIEYTSDIIRLFRMVDTVATILAKFRSISQTHTSITQVLLLTTLSTRLQQIRVSGSISWRAEPVSSSLQIMVFRIVKTVNI